jgi:hypothetical protein
MKDLKTQLAALPTVTANGRTYLSYQAATDCVAAFLFPSLPPNQIDEAGYQRILETADQFCQELGYTAITRLAPPAVPLHLTGLYWTEADPEKPDMVDTGQDEPFIIDATLSRVEEWQAGRLVDARIAHLEEVSRQHFKIPVTLTDAVYDLIRRAAANQRWLNDEKGIWHDILGMAVMAGRDVSPTERRFTVIIRGAGARRYRQMKLLLRQDNAGEPYLEVALADEPDRDPTRLFELGHCIATDGVAALGVDLKPYLDRHAAGDWGQLGAVDKRANDRAVKEGTRILSAYDSSTMPFEFLTGRPMGANDNYNEWFAQQFEEQIGNLSLEQLWTLFIWATAEWQRAKKETFLLPTTGAGAQFAAYKEVPCEWRASV